MNQEKKSLYKAELLDHFKRPRNKQQGPFPDNVLTARGRIPRCGDDIEIGVEVSGDDSNQHVDYVGFRGRGCSVCLASASMMTEAVKGATVETASALGLQMQKWVDNALEDDLAIPELLLPLEAVKDHPARKKCVMLCWNALGELLTKELAKSS